MAPCAIDLAQDDPVFGASLSRLTPGIKSQEPGESAFFAEISQDSHPLPNHFTKGEGAKLPCSLDFTTLR